MSLLGGSGCSQDFVVYNFRVGMGDWENTLRKWVDQIHHYKIYDQGAFIDSVPLDGWENIPWTVHWKGVQCWCKPTLDPECREKRGKEIWIHRSRHELEA